MLTPRHSCRLQHRLRTWQPRRRPMLMLRWAELLGTLCEGWMSLAATTNAGLLDAHATGEAASLCRSTMPCAVFAEALTLCLWQRL